MGHLSRLIAFDLDGTLIDSQQDLADSANALIVERGGEPLPSVAIARMVGEGAAVLVRRALTAARLPVREDAVPRFLELYDDRLLRHTRPYTGIMEVLGRLAEAAHLAVLTNKPLRPTRTLLKRLDLERFFGEVLGGDGPLPRKPDPASLRSLMSTFGASRAETVLVGDSPIDFHTARNAGVQICVAAYGFGYNLFPTEPLEAGVVVARTPAEIPALVLPTTTQTS